jgi:hypothetical protein
VGENLVIDNVQLLIALASGITLCNNSDIDLIKMRDHPPKGDTTPLSSALGNHTVHMVGQLLQEKTKDTSVDGRGERWVHTVPITTRSSWSSTYFP